ncbi:MULTISPECIES: carbon monoxide dehydrogenase/acetyl-CoA synthase methytransferase subunit [Dehalobacter]|jgi:5-methyltetrahydrofolate corrinoid/iron sulfur protein methyltransferase|uniref:Carbon monoxide dehydrogenase n=2 Tax=Dehalobacter restrictus TaxID=55583 RepID=A0A857DEU4_9FIRM|nr:MULTISPECIES: carbon monoxide dehydrogenase/acetyl-CoA synthase methytransferase subunit [Dehalobacter]AHF08834.1 carbon monoxide dehydrogenase [Dehalobacter restrictus DSM 9455]MCG1024145.1 dihydropteroate synthase [Dehalobacter sp.]OCZ50010.1 carbon monoxide dehydrogenase [Dehalobacter sp. TeCB1]QGZ99332.1 carbon monoxide dehydrogenase [Dehalobacter restrictus]
MDRFLIIGERIHCISPVIRQAIADRNPAPILQRAKEQLDAGAVYLDLNIGPAERDGEEVMAWAVQLLQNEFDNVPICLDTANKKAIEAGIRVYNRSKGKPIINSADAGPRLGLLEVAAANDAMAIALCAKDGIPSDVEERITYCTEMLEKAMMLGIDPMDLLFDPLFLVIKGMQEKAPEVLETIRQITEMGLRTNAGLSNVSNGAPKHVRPIIDATYCAMAMQCGLTAAIVNPCDHRLMETIKTCDMIKGNMLYADSYLEL